MSTSRDAHLRHLLDSSQFIEADRFTSNNIVNDTGWVLKFSNHQRTIKDYERLILFKEPPSQLELDRLQSQCPDFNHCALRQITKTDLAFRFRCEMDTSD